MLHMVLGFDTEKKTHKKPHTLKVGNQVLMGDGDGDSYPFYNLLCAKAFTNIKSFTLTTAPWGRYRYHPHFT